MADRYLITGGGGFICSHLVKHVLAGGGGVRVVDNLSTGSAERVDRIGTNLANVTATLNLLENSRRAGVRRFVYAASSSAYGDTEVLPKNEEMPANPLSPYALQKWVGERYCKLFHELYALETVSLRYFNVFGPGQDPYSEYSAVVPRFITKLLAKEPITV